MLHNEFNNQYVQNYILIQIVWYSILTFSLMTMLLGWMLNVLLLCLVQTEMPKYLGNITLTMTYSTQIHSIA